MIQTNQTFKILPRTFQTILIRNELMGELIFRMCCEQNKEYSPLCIVNWQFFFCFVIWFWFVSIWQHNEIAIKMFASHWCHRRDRWRRKKSVKQCQRAMWKLAQDNIIILWILFQRLQDFVVKFIVSICFSL